MGTFHSRVVPTVPDPGGRLAVIIDSDVANEIDDLCAIALALAATDRFDLRGFVATHFAQWASTHRWGQVERQCSASTTAGGPPPAPPPEGPGGHLPMVFHLSYVCAW